VQSPDQLLTCSERVEIAVIHHSLHFDVGTRLDLEVPPHWIGHKFVLERTVNVARQRVVPFDEIAVVAVH